MSGVGGLPAGERNHPGAMLPDGVDLIDKHNWSGTGVEIKGDAYEA